MRAVWMGWAALGVLLSACAESRAGEESALSGCFEGRALEEHGRKLDKECVAEIDVYGDGTIDERTVNTFDEQGRLIEVRVGERVKRSIDLEVWTRQGVVRRRETSYLDGGRRSIEVVTDSRGPDNDVVYERRFDGAGNVLAMATDNGNDGTVDMCAYASYACWTESR